MKADLLEKYVKHLHGEVRPTVGGFLAIVPTEEGRFSTMFFDACDVANDAYVKKQLSRLGKPLQ